MRKILLSALTILVVQVALVPSGQAEDVTGCPLGLKRGEFWFKAPFKVNNMTERYDRAEDHMVDLLGEEHNRVCDLGLRLGYGLTDRWDVGCLSTLRWVDKRIYNKKAKEWQEVESNGLQGVWIASRYKFYHSEETGVFDEVHLNFGVGIKLPISSSAKIKEGIGNGAREFRIVFLSHETVGRFSFCNHLFYNWRGKASDISGWKHSGQDLPDRVNYKFNVEFDLLGNGMLEPSVGLVGWQDMEDVELAGEFADCGLDGDKAHDHAVSAGIEVKPWGERYDHRKFAVKVRIPYEVKSTYAPDYTLTVMAMFTFKR
jgi:hypothetical protein